MPLFKTTPAPKPAPAPEPTLEQKLQQAIERKSGAERLILAGSAGLDRASADLGDVRDQALDEVNRLTEIASTAQAQSTDANIIATSVLDRLPTQPTEG